ncbi:MAG: hypothetical protein ACTSO9_05250 [Candidatus Helarchaeota archaeon]
MSSSIKIKKEDKEKLNRIQAKLTLLLGKKLTQEDIISRLLDLVENKEKNLLEQIFNEYRPFTSKEIQKLLALSEDWGVKTKEDDIDRILYGMNK